MTQNGLIKAKLTLFSRLIFKLLPQNCSEIKAFYCAKFTVRKFWCPRYNSPKFLVIMCILLLPSYFALVYLKIYKIRKFDATKHTKLKTTMQIVGGGKQYKNELGGGQGCKKSIPPVPGSNQPQEEGRPKWTKMFSLNACSTYSHLPNKQRGPK